MNTIRELTHEEIVAAIRADAISEAVAWLKSLPVVTLAGRGGAYELLARRAEQLRRNIRPEES